MTRDEIVQIAWDVGLFMRSHKIQDEPTKLERFAERIAAAEREACLVLVNQGTGEATSADALKILRMERDRISAAIRARGNDNA